MFKPKYFFQTFLNGLLATETVHNLTSSMQGLRELTLSGKLKECTLRNGL